MNESPRSIPGVERKLALVALVALALGCGLVLVPFLSATLWAIVLCVACWPLYTRMLGWLGHRRTLVAALLAGAMILVVLLPFVTVGLTLADDIKNVSAGLHKRMAAGPPAAPAWLAKLPVVGSEAVAQWNALTSDTAQLREQVKRWVEPVSNWLLAGVLFLAAGLWQLGLSIFVAFFLFRDGGALGEKLLVAVGRVAGDRGQRLLTTAAGTVRGVVYGVLGTALTQGIATAIGLWIAGVPNVALWGLLAFFVAIVPLAGPALVWVPAALWLFGQGATGWAIFLVVWGVIVNNIDNILKPYLISKGCDLPFILIFFGVLGGALAFGFLGVFLGPALLAVGYRLLTEWNAIPAQTTPGAATPPASPPPAEPAPKPT